MFDLASVQKALAELRLDGWLLYDFRGLNVLAVRVLGFESDAILSRRWFYWVPASGRPRKLVHAIEDSALDHLPGEKTVYLRWEELEAGVAALVGEASRVAMEYSPRNANPYISRVDAGTLELVRDCGADVVSSGDLVQFFEAVWDEEQWRMHLDAATVTDAAFDVAWRCIADGVRSGGGVDESAVRDAVMQHFEDHDCTTYHLPIVARGPHSGLPHYETGGGDDTTIREGDFVLVDLWCKLKRPRAVYSDVTRTGFVGESVPEEYLNVFNIVAAARDAGIEFVRQAFAEGRQIQGWEVDDAVRTVIDETGYGAQFRHRTGHNIGREVHGNGAHMDNLETHETRRVLPRTCFSIEPGIYLPEFGIRSEVDVYVDADGGVHVTGGPQAEVLPVLAKN